MIAVLAFNGAMKAGIASGARGTSEGLVAARAVKARGQRISERPKRHTRVHVGVSRMVEAWVWWLRWSWFKVGQLFFHYSVPIIRVCNRAVGFMIKRVAMIEVGVFHW